jgi:hypothetical protein
MGTCCGKVHWRLSGMGRWQQHSSWACGVACSNASLCMPQGAHWFLVRHGQVPAARQGRVPETEVVPISCVCGAGFRNTADMQEIQPADTTPYAFWRTTA